MLLCCCYIEKEEEKRGGGGCCGWICNCFISGGKGKAVNWHVGVLGYLFTEMPSYGVVQLETVPVGNL